MNRKALGKGLGALIPEKPQSPPASAPAAPAGHATEPTGTWEVSVTLIQPNPYQPRTVFDPEALAELAASIKQSGLIQPLIVRDAGDGTYELIAGERRFMASQQAGLETVPVVIRKASRREMLEVAMVENLQREDLNPMEEAEAFERLAAEFGLTQENIAQRVGKNRTTITNSMRLLSLPEEIRDLVSRGTLSAGHARALLSINDDATRLRVAREIVRKTMSVRQTELKVQQMKKGARPATKKRSHPALEAYENRLRTRFATQVRIVGGVGRGKVELHYFNEEDLERILSLSGISVQL